MTTPADYREFARDCLRWAEQASDAAQSDTLIGIARMWMRTALIMEEHATLAKDAPKLFQDLRAKLD
jgi:hypothetical protein